MPEQPTLAAHLASGAASGGLRAETCAALEALAGATIRLSELIGQGALAGDLSRPTGQGGGGDTQKLLDAAADNEVRDALMRAPVGPVVSEEGEGIIELRPGQPLAVAVDPLDGSSNIETNMTLGTIFSVRANTPATGPLGPFAGPGTAQLAAGFVAYGPQTALVLTTGAGVDVFVLDRAARAYRLAQSGLKIAPDRPEYAINASNYRHWEPPVRAYIDDCLAGADGPRGKDFNMRWVASLVAEVYRILMRGGIFLYPADARPGYGQGRLRLLYEAQPMAMIAEQAGGWATDGFKRILDLEPASPHQRTPLILGSADKVARVEALHRNPGLLSAQQPLFGRRGLFRL